MKIGTYLTSVAIAMLLVLSSVMPGFASISPTTLEATLAPGGSITETKTVFIPEVPARADVIFAFDLTGSMYGIISTAKSQSGAIMTALDATGVDINYGVVSYMDYPHDYTSFGYWGSYGSYPCGGGDYAYRLDSPITADRTAVTSAINALVMGCGADGPQDYTRIMYESYADPNVSWRPGSKKILLNFGDNVPHDNNLYEGVPGYSGTYSTGGDPGRNEIMDETTDPAKIGVGNDDLNLQTVLSEMAANNVIMLESHTYAYGFMLDAWNYWTGITGGKLFTTDSSTLPADVVTEVTAALTSPDVDNVHLAASSGFETWISSPDSYTGPTGVTQTFTVTITVPSGAPDGDYTFQISAVDSSGVSYGDQDVTIHVVSAVPAGNVTGGGKITVPAASSKGKNNIASFGFVAHYADSATIPSGNMQYTDQVSGMNVHGNVTTLSVDETTMTAVFSGTAKVNGVDGYAYTVTVVDNGEPGKADTFAISIPAMSYSASGTLSGGNIQIHNP